MPTEAVRPHPTSPGSRFGPGGSLDAQGVNLCVFGRHVSRVELSLHAAAGSPDSRGWTLQGFCTA